MDIRSYQPESNRKWYSGVGKSIAALASAGLFTLVVSTNDINSSGKSLDDLSKENKNVSSQESFSYGECFSRLLDKGYDVADIRASLDDSETRDYLCK